MDTTVISRPFSVRVVSALQLIILLDNLQLVKWSSSNSACTVICMRTVCFTISSRSQIPLQLAKWLGVSETIAPHLVGPNCVLTDVQVLVDGSLRVLALVDDQLLDNVFRIPGWVQVYDDRRANEALCTAPLPSWVVFGTDQEASRTKISNVAVTKQLAELMLTLFDQFKLVEQRTHEALRLCLWDTVRLAVPIGQSRGSTHIVVKSLTDQQMESILDFADRWRVAFTISSDGRSRNTISDELQKDYEDRLLLPKVLLDASRETLQVHQVIHPYGIDNRKALRHEVWYPNNAPVLAKIPNAYLGHDEAIVSVTGRTRYIPRGRNNAYWKNDSKNATHRAPFVTTINVEDTIKLCKVAYLGPDYKERMWFYLTPPIEAKQQLLYYGNILATALAS